jgi:hypothetical protein
MGAEQEMSVEFVDRFVDGLFTKGQQQTVIHAQMTLGSV